MKNQAALTLGSLVKGSNKNKIAVLKADGIPPLTKIFLTSTEAKLVENVTSVIRNLSTNTSIAAELVKAGIVPKLVSFLQLSTPPSQLSESIHTLTNIASHGTLFLV